MTREYSMTCDHDEAAGTYDCTLTETITSTLDYDSATLVDPVDSNAVNNSYFLEVDIAGASSYFWFADDFFGYQDSINLVSSDS